MVEYLRSQDPSVASPAVAPPLAPAGPGETAGRRNMADVLLKMSAQEIVKDRYEVKKPPAWVPAFSLAGAAAMAALQAPQLADFPSSPESRRAAHITATVGLPLAVAGVVSLLSMDEIDASTAVYLSMVVGGLASTYHAIETAESIDEAMDGGTALLFAGAGSILLTGNLLDYFVVFSARRRGLIEF